MENLVNEFVNFFNDKTDAIRMNIGVIEPPFIPSREGLFINLDTFALVSKDDVCKLVIKSSSMPTKLVKEYIEELLPLLAYIINRSIASGEFPHEWKTALVMQLLKKAGMDLILKNYRPVSNLQYVTKLTERDVVNQLCLHSECRFPFHSRALYQN